jgi:nucleotide-binding universal stress UspA family protein
MSSSGPVIIGYDGSAVADHAIREAGALLGPRPALVVVVWEAGAAYEMLGGTRIQAVPIDIGPAVDADQAMYEGARNMAANGTRLATEAGFAAHGLLAADEISVAKTLIRLAVERDAPAVVVGARGHNRLEKLLLGSTSRGLVEHAPCPVLVVNQPES